MKKYFFSIGQDKEGPVSLVELKQKDLKPNTLIWHEGLEDWAEAKNIEELKEIFELSPPPIDSDNDNINSFESVGIDSKEKTNSSANLGMFAIPFSFDGRIRRSEYGISFLIVVFIVTLLAELLKNGYSFASIGYIPTYWFLWAQGAKRCHDLDNNGWFQIIPFYIFWLIFKSGNNQINQYGRPPKR
jgi:uncharacterized membrane protein YhaH (DUF805 family)